MIIGQLIIHNGARPEIKCVTEKSSNRPKAPSQESRAGVSTQVESQKKERLTMMKRGVKWLPTKRGNAIQVPCNRSFLMRPQMSFDVWMPTTASRDVFLHPLLFHNIRVETGFIPKGSYMRCRLTNTSQDIIHITEKQCFVCFQSGGEEWEIMKPGGGEHTQMHFLARK